MSGGKGYTFASENEDEMNDWIAAFNAALKKKPDSPEGHQNDEILDKGWFFDVLFSFVYI